MCWNSSKLARMFEYLCITRCCMLPTTSTPYCQIEPAHLLVGCWALCTRLSRTNLLIPSTRCCWCLCMSACLAYPEPTSKPISSETNWVRNRVHGILNSFVCLIIMHTWPEGFDTWLKYWTDIFPLSHTGTDVYVGSGRVIRPSINDFMEQGAQDIY